MATCLMQCGWPCFVSVRESENLSTFFLVFFKRSLQSLNAEVYSFLEGVAYFFGVKFFAWQEDMHANFLVQIGFGFYYFEGYFYFADFLIALGNFCCFFLDECLQFFGCIEVNGLNF